MKRILLSVVWLMVSAWPAAASTITWEFAGVTTVPSPPDWLSELPTGTPFTFDWTFDPAEPSTCPAGSAGGVYQHQAATLTFQSPSGLLAYHGHGFLVSDSILPIACPSAPFWSRSFELRLFEWTGPAFADGRISPFDPMFPHGLFWEEPISGGGAFPTVPPPTARLEQQPFDPFPLVPLPASCPSFPVQCLYYPTELRDVVTFTPTPEPSTMLLLGSGVLFLIRRRRR